VRLKISEIIKKSIDANMPVIGVVNIYREYIDEQGNKKRVVLDILC